MKMLKQLRWFFLLAYTRANFVIEGPHINSDPGSERGLQKMGNVYYVLANTKPTFGCHVSIVDCVLKPMDLKWYLNGESVNASKVTSEKVGNTGFLNMYFAYDSGSSFTRNELKCVLNVTRPTSDLLGYFDQAIMFLEVARPVSDVKAFFSPENTTKLTAPIRTEFDAYCIANGVPEATFVWHAMYPGSTLWNEVAFTRNFSEIVIQEEFPGPTFYRCQAVNLANRDTRLIASPLLELNHIESVVTSEPTWVVTVNTSQDLVAKNISARTGDQVDHSVVDSVAVVPIIPIVLAIAGTVVVGIVIFFGIILYIKYRRRRLEHFGSGGKASRSMKPYSAPHPLVQSKTSEDSADPGYSSVVDVPSYLEIVADPRKNSESAGDVFYLTPKTTPNFLPLPNIPGRTPPTSKKNSPANSVDGEDNDVEGSAREKDYESINNIYNEIPLYNEIPTYENDPPPICISKVDVTE